MIRVSVKELLHNFSAYKKKVKSGERVVILEHKKPIMDLSPYTENMNRPGWRRDHFVLPADGRSLTETCLKIRREERS